MIEINDSLLIFSIILSCIIALIILNAKRLSSIKKRKYKEGIEWLSSFREILALIQKHRGLTNGFINGDSSLLNSIMPLQHNINYKISALNQQGKWLNNNEYWLGITDHWQRLSKRYSTSLPHINYEQHNNLIASLLYLIEECAENHQLQELVFEEGYDASFLWQKLLYCTEYIGQLRALGTGIAASQKSTSVQRIKLSYLQSQINDFIATNHFTEVQSHIEKLITTVNKDIIATQPTIAAQDYFNLATVSLDKVFAQFDQHILTLKLTH